MKTTIRTQGAAEYLPEEVIAAVMEPDFRKHLTAALMAFTQKEIGITPKTIQYKEGRMPVGIIDYTTDDGVKPIGTVKKETVDKTSTKGFTQTWQGLYGGVAEIIDIQRKRKKDFIAWTDLLAELHDMETERGTKMFIKNGEKLPMSVLRQRMAPSQLVRAAKTQPSFRGIKHDKNGEGLKI